MSIIKCSNCGNQISNKASFCPNCGKKNEDNNMNNPTAKGVLNKVKNMPKKIRLFFIVFVLIVSLTIFSVNFFSLDKTEKANVSSVEKLIENIGTITKGSGNNISLAEKQYEDLSLKCRFRVRNREMLLNAREKYDSIWSQELVDSINDILSLPFDDEFMFKLDEVEDKCGFLTETQKKKVYNFSEFEKKRKDYEFYLIDNLTTEIDNIIKKNSISENQIRLIEEKYNRISEGNKNSVFNYSDFLNLKDSILKEKIKECISLIDSIGRVSLGSKNRITRAEELYNELNNEQKNSVTNYSKLEEAKNKYNALKNDNDRIKEEKKKIITIGSTISNSNWSLKLLNVNLSASIYPNNTSGYYTYYSSDDSNVYLDFIFTAKNVSTDSLHLENIISNVKVIYDGKYNYNQYDAFYSYGDRIDKVYSWDSIGALCSTTYHVAILLPREVKSNNKSLKVYLSFNGEEKIYNYR